MNRSVDTGERNVKEARLGFQEKLVSIRIQGIKLMSANRNWFPWIWNSLMNRFTYLLFLTFLFNFCINNVTIKELSRLSQSQIF